MIRNSFKNQSVIEFVYKIMLGDQMKKIILIEDDEILSSGIESYLSKNDFEVEICKNFEEAKIKINNSFDLAILGWNQLVEDFERKQCESNNHNSKKR